MCQKCHQGQLCLTIQAEKVSSFLEKIHSQGEEVNSPTPQASSYVDAAGRILTDKCNLAEYTPVSYFSFAVLLLQTCFNQCMTK